MQTYTLDGTEAAELALEILFISTVIKTRHYQRLESISSDVGIVIGVVCKNKTSYVSKRHNRQQQSQVKE